VRPHELPEDHYSVGAKKRNHFAVGHLDGQPSQCENYIVVYDFKVCDFEHLLSTFLTWSK